MQRSPFLLTAAAVAAIGCGSPASDDVAPEHVHVLDGDERIRAVEVTAEAVELTLVTPGDDLGIAVGDLVVGSDGPGYLRGVQAAEFAGSKLRLRTRYASLAEAVDTASAHEQFPLHAASRRYRATIPLVDLGGTVLVDTEIAGVPLRITLPEGSVALVYDFDFDVSFGFFTLEELSAVAEGSIELALAVHAEVGGPVDYAYEIDLNGADPFYTQDIDFALGPIPVRGKLDLDFQAGFRIQGDGAGTLDAGVDAGAALRVGAGYRRGEGWRAIFEPDVSFTTRPVTWTADVDLDLAVWVRPLLRTELYGNPGPTIDLRKVFRTKLVKHGGGTLPYRSAADGEGFVQTVCLTGELDYQVRVLSLELASFAMSLPCNQTIVAGDPALADDMPPTDPGGDDADDGCRAQLGDGWRACEGGGRCIHQSWMCDAIPDCPDDADEDAATCADDGGDPTQQTCEEQLGDGWTSCPTGGKCIHSSWLCDRVADCPDGEDEQDC